MELIKKNDLFVYILFSSIDPVFGVCGPPQQDNNPNKRTLTLLEHSTVLVLYTTV